MHDSPVLDGISGRKAERAARALYVAYGGPNGAVPPARWPGSYLGRLAALYPALVCISSPSVRGVSARDPDAQE